MDDRLRSTSAPSTTPTPEGLPFAGGDAGHLPGSGLHRIHEEGSRRGCSTCREDPAVPELNYRLVLRCTTTPLDH